MHALLLLACIYIHWWLTIKKEKDLNQMMMTVL